MSSRSSKLATLLAGLTPELAWGNGQAEGVRIGVIDSGIDAHHDALEGCVAGGVEITMSADGPVVREQDPVRDDFGHGTACAGLIHALAPAAQLYSIKVLGANCSGHGEAFLEGVRWAVANDMHVVNLSLGTTNRRYYDWFHQLVDDAYYAGCILVAAANNVPPPSIPSMFSSLISVDAADFASPEQFSYNVGKLIEMEGRGIRVEAPWLDNSYRQVTGTSFATPHIAGLVARLVGANPGLTPFQAKTILCSVSSNAPRRALVRAHLGARAVRARRLGKPIAGVPSAATSESA